MTTENMNKLFNDAKRYYNIMQVFTYATAIIFFVALYLYFCDKLDEFGTIAYYTFFIMGAASLVLGFKFSKKLSSSMADINTFFSSHPVALAKFIKNKAFQGIINILLIGIIVASFFMSGIQLQLINNFFFILIIFSYWYSSYVYYQVLKGVIEG